MERQHLVARALAVVAPLLPFFASSQAVAQESVFSGNNNVVYGILPDGNLQWYRHNGAQTGTTEWLGPRTVGTGWQSFSHVFSGGNGVIYGILPNGNLQWYTHTGWPTGTMDWIAGGGGRNVGTGWQAFTQVFSEGNGIIYGILPNGNLQWYRHDGWLTGTMAWTAGSGGRTVGTGWNQFTQVFSGGNGIIYGILPNGNLQWYKHDGWLTGTMEWTAGDGGRTVGTGWNQFTHVFSGSNGIIYGILPNGNLQWYKHNGRLTGTMEWTAGNGGRTVGTGWTVFM